VLLPIEGIRPAFEQALRERGRVVVTAPTGSGKSTRVPLWCAEHGRVLVVEPRRLACRSLARWVAKSRSEKAGQSIGFAVRHEATFGEKTQVVYATPGTALRMLQGRRFAFDVLVLDEFHERQIDVDLVLALALAKDHPRIVVMSATLGAHRLGTWLDAAVVEGEGRTFPVTVEHHDQPPIPTKVDLAGRVAQAVRSALESHSGDVLVFLPGKGEIGACARALTSVGDVEVLPLHGGSTGAEQARVFAEAGPRRVVLATNVAETSITLPRVGVVIDSGLVRQTRYHHGRSVLRMVPVAGDAAEQRRGRAGRVGPGHCVRLWNAAATIEGVTRPEILRSELADAALAVAAMGYSLRDLRLPDPPEPYMIDSAEQTLRRLGCLGASGISEVGSLVASHPLDARLARFLVEVRRREQGPVLDDAVALVAALSAGRSVLLQRRGDGSDERREWEAACCDATALIRAVYMGVASRDELRPESLREARRIASQLGGKLHRDRTPDRHALARAAIASDPDTAFVRRKRGSRLGGPGRELAPSRDTLLSEEADAAVVYATHTSQATGTRLLEVATCASPITIAFLRSASLGTPKFERTWRKRGALWCSLKRVYGGVPVGKEDLCPQGPLAAQALTWAVEKGALFSKGVAETRDRAALWALHRRLNREHDLPAFDAEAWLAGRADALGFEEGRDLALLEEEDFIWPWPSAFDAHTRERLARVHPLRIDMGAVSYSCTYHTGRRVVTLELVRGKRKDPPPLSYLPSWSGWGIELKRASNVRKLR
jgi:ATP-dependent helicase HrpB